MQLGHTSNPWKLKATLRDGTGDNSEAKLIGNTTISFEKGYATFTDLAIDRHGSGFMLDFAVVYPDDSTLAVSSSVGIAITHRQYKVEVISVPSDAVVDESFSVTVAIKDLITDGFPQGIADKVINQGYTPV